MVLRGGVANGHFTHHFLTEKEILVENGDKLLHGIGKWGTRQERRAVARAVEEVEEEESNYPVGTFDEDYFEYDHPGSGEEEEDGYGFWPRVVSADDDKEDEWMEDGEGGTRWM